MLLPPLLGVVLLMHNKPSSTKRSYKRTKTKKTTSTPQIDSLFADVDNELMRSLRLQKGLSALR